MLRRCPLRPTTLTIEIAIYIHVLLVFGPGVVNMPGFAQGNLPLESLKAGCLSQEESPKRMTIEVYQGQIQGIKTNFPNLSVKYEGDVCT